MRRRLAGVLLGLMMALLLIPVASASAVGCTISGNVVDAFGEPEAGAFVQLWDEFDENQVGATVVSGIDGEFTLGPVANGDYIIQLSDTFDSFDGSAWWSYTYVTVAGGNLGGVVVVDGGAPEAGPTGAVTVLDDLTGLPIPDADVYSDSDWTMTEANGVATLDAGPDEVTIEKAGYVTQYLPELVAESNVEVRLVLDAGYGLVTGVVKDEATGLPILRDLSAEASIYGTVYNYDEFDDFYYEDSYFYANEEGSFAAAAPAGDVFVSFWDDNGDYAYEWYQDATFPSDATPVSIFGGAVTQILPELSAGATISGLVTVSGGWSAFEEYAGQYVEAWAFSETDNLWEPLVWWDAPGNEYAISNLPAGNYKISMHTILADPSGNPVRSNGGELLYVDAWYKDGAAVQFTDDDMFDKMELADTVTVTEGQDLAGINFALTRPPSTVTRVAGTTRYDVAANLARKGWDPLGDKSWEGVEHIIVACGDNGKEADPLAAAGLAGVYNCPVLLTGVTSLPASTKTVITEIAAANPGVQVHLIGGVNSVPDARWYMIKAIRGVSPTKDRLAGTSRYDVSVSIAEAMVDEAGVESLGGVLIVAGDNINGFYDALAASPIAYANTMPILSVQKGVVPAGVANLLKVDLDGVPRYVVNSSTYVSDATKGKVGATVRLTTSANRYTAASQIAAAGITRDWLTPSSTAVAAKLPDALTGGVYSGRNRGVMLFTDSTSYIQTATKSFITGRKASIFNGWVLGGTNSVPAGQETSFRNLVK